MPDTEISTLAALSTEGRNPRSMELDTLETEQILRLMNDEDATVAGAVRAALPVIAQAADRIAEARRAGGRLIYLGAGTSGRIGLLDAVECPPTFGTSPEDVLGVMAGGSQAFVRAVEGAEDDPELAERELDAVALRAEDIVVGLAASGRTPYVIGGLRAARRRGAATISIACNAGAPISAEADIAIEVVTGPEVLTGSTRLKAGTAQKLVCNMLSTASMVRGGKAYGNLMVDVRPSNAKLVDRAQRIVAEATGASRADSDAALASASDHAKTAVVMLLADCDAQRAAALLTEAEGSVRQAVELAAG
ncbi:MULTISPECIES: N-acetylmuramic acid 6-phosphate etherase [unclassified Pseudoclavibacter]|uniref:N-acetylmuramic acid 6-phosphate etherase n=1 Tax=unclassified Pseudoclavibacter TaxID=2615177 RepID=UPI0012F3E20C|nr:MULTISPECIES: N-acetylmuramic acid 6-phosphate etherase [unclassified Pseudoclavibacter]MBF4459223.1 N-acetylmuramic acid 6-phosphate etherase [Pseudoclavibacter sp. VKM Ac-2867]VXC38664.1 D-lactyl ether N-acetylmuramic-6-phosphate acid etherase [Pseudoclavibacter sp. 8L]